MRLGHRAWRVPIRKVDKYRRIVYGEVYVPNIEDAHGNWMRPEEVEKAAHRFMLNLQTLPPGEAGIDREHNLRTGYGYVVESFIARPGDPDFTEGAWVLATYVADDQTWQDILDGKITGYSLFGWADVVPGTKPVTKNKRGRRRMSVLRNRVAKRAEHMAPPGEMRDVDVTHVSLTGDPANGRSYRIFKSRKRRAAAMRKGIRKGLTARGRAKTRAMKRRSQRLLAQKIRQSLGRKRRLAKQETFADANIIDELWRLVWVLEDTIAQILESEGENPGEDIIAAIDDFRSQVANLFGVTVAAQADTAGGDGVLEDEDIDEIVDAVEEAVESVVEDVVEEVVQDVVEDVVDEIVEEAVEQAVEELQDDVQDLSEAVEELIEELTGSGDEGVAELVGKAVAPVMDRLTALEQRLGKPVRKSLPPTADDGRHRTKKGFWGGIFAGK